MMAKVTSKILHSSTSASATGGSWDVAYCPTVVLQVEPSSFSGSIDIQGSVDNDNWANAPWVRQDTAGGLTTSIAAIDMVQDSTRRYYRIVGYWPWVRVSVARTTGSITVKGYATDAAIPVAFA